MEAEKAILILNEIHKLDPDVLGKLVSYRVPCNIALANHPTVQVSQDYKVGLLGIINGLCGIKEDGYGFIAAKYDKDRLVKFILLKEDK